MNTKLSWRMRLGVVCVAVLLVTAVGCAKKRKDVPISPYDTSSTSKTTGAETTTIPGGGLPSDVDVEALFWSKDTGLQAVYFDFDRYNLRPDAKASLEQNAEKIKQIPSVYVQIEGHCDERGTQEYNFALGERRALAVREYLMNLGVSGDRLLTISYGEEVPADSGQNEAAWAKNRRCEFSKAK